MATVSSINFMFLTVSLWIHCDAFEKFLQSKFASAPAAVLSTNYKQAKIFPATELTGELVEKNVVDLIDKKNKKQAVIYVDDVIKMSLDNRKTTLMYKPGNSIKVIYGNSTPYITVDEHWEGGRLALQATLTDLRLANNNQPMAILTAKESNAVEKSEIKCQRPYLYSKFTATAFGTSAVGWSYNVHSDTLTVDYHGQLVHFNGVNQTIAGPAAVHFNRINSSKKNRTTWLSADSRHRIDLTSIKLHYRYNNGAVLRLWQSPRLNFLTFESLVIVTVRVYENGARVGQVRWPASGSGILADDDGYGGDWNDHRKIKKMLKKIYGNDQKSVKKIRQTEDSNKYDSTVYSSFLMHCGVPANLDASFLAAAIWPARQLEPRSVKLWAEDGSASMDSALDEFGPLPSAYRFVYKDGGRTVILQKIGTVRFLIEPKAKKQ